MSQTPMLDKVRQYAKDWGIKVKRTMIIRAATHEGPGIFGIHWPSREIVEPITNGPKHERVATDSDTWYLIHEISHVLVNVEPTDVDELRSATLALDYYAGVHLGLGDGWDGWMEEFTLDDDMAMAMGFSATEASLGVKWGLLEQTAQDRLIRSSREFAVEAGLLTPQGVPTFNRSAWMPTSMQAEKLLMPLALAVVAEMRRRAY